MPAAPSVAPFNGATPHLMVDTEPASNGTEAGEPLTVERLIASHHVALYRYAYRLSGSAQDAEDLVQQVFVTVCRKLDQVREPEHVTAWLFAVLRSCFLKSCRKPRPQLAAGVDLNLDTVPDRSPAPAEVDSDELQKALEQLPPEYRLVVVMFYFEHCSYKQIADRLELPIGTVMSRLARAKQRLRIELTDRKVPSVHLPPPKQRPEGPAALRPMPDSGR